MNTSDSYATKTEKICYAFMRLKPENMHLKQVLCNYLNKQIYSDFFVLTTFFIIFRLNLLVFIVVLINLEF